MNSRLNNFWLLILALVMMAPSASATASDERQAHDSLDWGYAWIDPVNRSLPQEELMGLQADDALAAQEILMDFTSFFDMGVFDTFHLAAIEEHDGFKRYRFNHFVTNIEIFDRFLAVDVWDEGHIREIWGNAMPLKGQPRLRADITPAQAVMMIENETGFLVAEVIEARGGLIIGHHQMPETALRFLLRLSTGGYFAVTVSATTGEILSNAESLAIFHPTL